MPPLNFKSFLKFSSIKSFNSKLSNLIDSIIKDPSGPSLPQIQSLHSELTEIENKRQRKKENPLYKLKKLEDEMRIKEMPTIFQDHKGLYQDFKGGFKQVEKRKKKEEEKLKKDKKSKKDEKKSKAGIKEEELQAEDKFPEAEQNEEKLKKDKKLKQNEKKIKAGNSEEESPKEDKAEERQKNERKQKEKEMKGKKIVLEEEDLQALQGKNEKVIFKNVPTNLVIKTLVFPKTKSEVLLLGIENRNEMHASFVIDLLKSLKIDTIINQISPDLPFFIRTEDNYKSAWESFVKGNFDYKFVVNPNPSNLADLVIESNKLQFFLDGALLHTPDEFELGSVFLYSNNRKSLKIEIDCMLSTFLYSHNNSDKPIPIIINDIPLLKYRENIVWNIGLKDLQDLFKSYLDSIQKKVNKNFDPCLLMPEIFIKPKIDYITEIIKQSCFIGKKNLALVDVNCVEFVADCWKNNWKLDEIINLQALLHCLNPQKNANALSFSDYIEKHVILDIMFDQFVNENFVRFKSFPFTGENTIGQEVHFNNVFMIWKHFYRMYSSKFNNISESVENVDKIGFKTTEFGIGADEMPKGMKKN